MAMTIETKRKPKIARRDNGVHPAVAGVMVTGLVGLVGWIGFRSLAPKAPNPVKMSPQMTWLKEKAVESGGDINKLNPEDRKRLEQEQGQHAAEALKVMSNPNFR